MFRVVTVVGTRPEAIKMFPVIKALSESSIVQPYVVITGQHAELCTDVLDMAGVTIDRRLTVDRKQGTINELSSQVIASIGDVLEELKLRSSIEGEPITIATMVHGDTTSAMAAGVASAQAGIPVAHVEAGLRTYNPRGPFPEEINRQVISKIATVQIAPTVPNGANLVREQVSPKHVFVSGNTSIDALVWATRQTPVWASAAVEELSTSDRPFIVVTLHRRENWDRLGEMCEAINEITRARPDVRVLFPMHPNPSVQKTVKEVLGSNPNVFLVEAMGYIEFAHALANATLAITDSGGIQEEAPSVGTPVLVARDETERQEGVEAGTLLLVGSDPAVIAGAALDLLNNEDRLAEMRDAWNPFGDGQAATRIRELVEYLIEGGAPPSPFGTGVSRIAVLKAAGYLVPTHASNLVEESRLHEFADHEPDDAHLPLA